MKRWQQYLDESGYTAHCNTPCPAPVYKWYGYKNGEVKEFDNEPAAQAFSKNIEKVEVKKDARKLYREVGNALYFSADALFQADYEAMFQHLPQWRGVISKVGQVFCENDIEDRDEQADAAEQLIEIFDMLLEAASKR